jgi:hypothetical protein
MMYWSRSCGSAIRLIPIYDSVVRQAYGRPVGFWLWLHDRLGDNGGALDRRLGELHRQAGLPVEVSRLRVLDVVLWMRPRPAGLSGAASSEVSGAASSEVSGAAC